MRVNRGVNWGVSREVIRGVNGGSIVGQFFWIGEHYEY